MLDLIDSYFHVISRTLVGEDWLRSLLHHCAKLWWSSTSGKLKLLQNTPCCSMVSSTGHWINLRRENGIIHNPSSLFLIRKIQKYYSKKHFCMFIFCIIFLRDRYYRDIRDRYYRDISHQSDAEGKLYGYKTLSIGILYTFIFWFFLFFFPS